MNTDNGPSFKRSALAFAAGVTIAAAVIAGSGCNTTEGVGEDIEAAGDAIDDAAEDAND
jgi:predicted small secreted protein